MDYVFKVFLNDDSKLTLTHWLTPKTDTVFFIVYLQKAGLCLLTDAYIYVTTYYNRYFYGKYTMTYS